MKLFSQLYREIDQTTKTILKVDALAYYFDQASDEDKLWTIALFTQRRPRRIINTTVLRSWVAERAGLSQWLFDESYHIVGDIAETITLVLPEPKTTSDRNLSSWISEMKSMRDKEDDIKKEFVLKAWSSLDKDSRFLFNKLITGGFRIGVSQKLMVKGLSKSLGVDENILAHRLMGDWDPEKDSFNQLLLEHNPGDNLSRPYPFYLAYALDMEPEQLGDPALWYAERKWDGIRGQLISRNNEIFIWSRAEELVTDKFPEFNVLTTSDTTDFVLDGEIICYKDGKLLPFNVLQTRIGRKNVAKKHLVEAPVIMIAYDILEYKGEDLRSLPMYERRELLESLCGDLHSTGIIHLSPLVPFGKWKDLIIEREKSREHHAEGLMLKNRDSIYRVGRKRGEWWKWKVDPMTVDAVMIYAQRGHVRRANLYTDYTFAVWSEEGKLVPFTKACSGLKDAEFREISTWVKKNTLERFGPVSMVKPELVFEIAFEGIAESRRHKSGIALRSPRMKRWRKDKLPQEADTLLSLKQLLSS